MLLKSLDWFIIGTFFVLMFAIGLISSRKSGKSAAEYFLSGRSMPWWLLGISMVATTFSADTPNLVTGMVRESGVAKNWAWWAFLITGMVTVFIYAKLWRRSNVMTDLGFYEMRYGGKAASFLRGFRALYLGIFFNCLIMGTVSLAAIKIGTVMFGFDPTLTIVCASVVVLVITTIGGQTGVIWIDFFQYSIAMTGAVVAAIYAVKQPEIGSLSNLINHPALQDKIQLFPDFTNPSVYIPLLIIPIAVQWWSVWYPGAEPGGGGYIAQRMLSAKDEKNAIGATLLFNFAHYALRPWPWIIVALASIIIFPDLESIRKAFPHIAEQYLKDDIAYPVMLTKLKSGWLGLVTASIIAAFMSTIGTHLNWGSSYVINDFYKRFVRKDAKDKELVLGGRICTVVLMVFAAIISLTFLRNATQAFDILLLSGAGTGAIYLLRWFWYRINAWTELVSMIVATIVAVVLVFGFEDNSLAMGPLDHSTVRLLIAVVITTITWITTTLLTKPENKETLYSFYEATKPGGPGWKKVILMARAEGKDIEGNSKGKTWQMPIQILCVFIGCILIYSSLFSIGSFIYGKTVLGFVLLFCALVFTFILFKLLGRLNKQDLLQQ